MQIRLAGWISTTEFFLVLRMSSLYEDFEDENLHPYSKADRFVAALMRQQPESNEKELRKLKEIELKQRVLQNRLREVQVSLQLRGAGKLSFGLCFNVVVAAFFGAGFFGTGFIGTGFTRVGLM